jgi:hypothetical protein
MGRKKVLIVTNRPNFIKFYSLKFGQKKNVSFICSKQEEEILVAISKIHPSTLFLDYFFHPEEGGEEKALTIAIKAFGRTKGMKIFSTYDCSSSEYQKLGVQYIDRKKMEEEVINS